MWEKAPQQGQKSHRCKNTVTDVRLHPETMENELPSNSTGIDTRQRRPRRLGKIRDAVRESKRSRSRLYKLSGTHPGLFWKEGRSTLVDLDRLQEVLARELRPAVIKVRS
jgi:hypothetical protein